MGIHTRITLMKYKRLNQLIVLRNGEYVSYYHKETRALLYKTVITTDLFM